MRQARKKRSPTHQVLTGIWYAIDERNLSLTAAGVAFYAMLAVFPAMAVTIAIWGFFADPVVMSEYLTQIHGVIPDAVYGIIETQLAALLAANSSTLGWTTGVSLVVMLYSVRNGVAALVQGLNTIYGSRSRGSFARVLESMILTLILIVMGIVALAVVVTVPLILNFVPLGGLNALILRYLPWIVMFVVVLLFLGLFYRWGPNVSGARQSWISVGGFLAAFLWVLCSLAFSIYLSNFGSYNRIYGSIGAVIALLMWLYITAYIVLFGAVVNAERARVLRRKTVQ